MISSEKAERKRFELWYNNHFDMEMITGPDDVESAWEIWRAALTGYPVNAIGYVGLSSGGEPTKFRTGNFGSAHPVYLSPMAATPQPEGDGWIKCSERLPTEADDDFNGCVWVRFEDGDIELMEGEEVEQTWDDDISITHWMPTGLKRPEPPNEGK